MSEGPSGPRQLRGEIEGKREDPRSSLPQTSFAVGRKRLPQVLKKTARIITFLTCHTFDLFDIFFEPKKASFCDPAVDLRIAITLVMKNGNDVSSGSYPLDFVSGDGEGYVTKNTSKSDI